MIQEKVRVPAALYIYVGLVLISLLYFASVAEESPMGAIFAMLLTVPWSIAISQIFSSFFPEFLEKVWVGPLILVFAAIVNSIIIVVMSNRNQRKKLLK